MSTEKNTKGTKVKIISLVRITMFLLTYLTISVISGILFLVSTAGAPHSSFLAFFEQTGIGSMVMHIYTYGSGIQLFLGLCIILCVVFVGGDLLIQTDASKEGRRVHSTTVGMILMTLANLSLSWEHHLSLVLINILNLLGIAVFGSLVIRSPNSHKAALAGFLALGNAVFIYWAQFLTALELATAYFVIPLCILFLAGIIFLVLASVIHVRLMRASS